MAAPFAPLGLGPIHLRREALALTPWWPGPSFPGQTVDSGDTCNGLVTGLLGIARVTMRTGLIQKSEDATQEGRGEIEL